MSVSSRKFIINPVRPIINVNAARTLVRNIIQKEIAIDPDWADDYELVGDLDDKGKPQETGGVWDFLKEVERLYSVNPATTDSDDEGAEENITHYAATPNQHGLPVWEITYAKYDSYTCMWIADCEYYNDNFPGLLSTIGITVWADKHYSEPSVLMK